MVCAVSEVTLSQKPHSFRTEYFVFWGTEPAAFRVKAVLRWVNVLSGRNELLNRFSSSTFAVFVP